MHCHIRSFFTPDDQLRLLHTVKNFSSWSDKYNQNYHLHVNDVELNKFRKIIHECMEHDDKYIYLFKVISLVFKKKYIFKNKPTKETLSSWMNPTPFKYPTGQELQKHTDKLPSPFQNMITLIFYLNDDYSGGEFCMEKNNKDVLIKPKMGDIIAIDNDTVHGSKKVITGNKYIAIFQFEAIMK